MNATVYNSTLSSSVVVGNSSGTPTATLQLTGAAALPTFSPYIINTLTFNNPGATVEYSGTTSQTVYTDASIANLSNTLSYYNLKFSGTGVKTASGGNLNVAGDFTNTLANDGSNYLDLSALGSPSSNTVNFNGTSQNLYGGGGNGTTFYNVECTNSGTKTMQSGTFYLADVGVLTMSGTNTKLAAGNKLFTLISDATSTATVATIPSGCSVTGTVNVQRFIEGSSADLTKRGYRLVSSTVYTGTSGGYNVSDVSWWQNSAIVTGPTGGGFDSSPFNNPSTYIYREDVTPSNANFTTGNYKGITAINNSPVYNIGTQKRLTILPVADTTVIIPVGNGTLFFFRGNRTSPNGTTGGTKTVSPFNYPENVTFTNSGTLNQGTVNVRLWYRTDNYLGYTNSASLGNSSVRGYNLVGNPYASTINWEKFNRNSSTSKSSIYGAGFTVPVTIWMFNPTNKQYEAYMQKNGSITTADTTTNINPGTAVGSASNMIASAQGFFIRATATLQTLTFSEPAKTTTQPSATKLNILMGMPKGSAPMDEPLVRIRMIEDDINTDEIVVRLNNNSSPAFATSEDAEDMGGINAEVALSALSSDSVKLAISRLPFPKGQAQQIVPLAVDAIKSGTYHLRLIQLSNLLQVYGVWLKDNFSNATTDLRMNADYSFEIDLGNQATFGTNRFQLVIARDPKMDENLLTFDATKAIGGALTSWKTTNEFNYTTFYIERSVDGNTFYPVGSLQSDGSGSYTFLDKKPVLGNNIYRLKQADFQDSITYSKLALVYYPTVNDTLNNKISVYPNPGTNAVNISLRENVQAPSYKIRMVNAAGKVVKEFVSQQPSWQANISDLEPGSYIVQVTNNSNKTLVGTTSFIKD